MKQLCLLNGIIYVEFTSADPNESFSEILGAHIVLRNLTPVDELTFRFEISRSDFRILKTICQKKGYKLKVLRQKGLYFTIIRASKRPILIAGILICIALQFWLPKRIFWVEVDGNIKIPSAQIIAAAEECGIRFGCVRKNIRSEDVKNRMLAMIPQLKWAGINTYGSRAVISVEERREGSRYGEKVNCDNLVAGADGIIESVIAEKGRALCEQGVAVTRGQLLISGYTDSGGHLGATGAKGEVYAYTRHTVRMIRQASSILRTGPGRSKINFTLLIGKNQIKFGPDSGIHTGTCDRIYKEYVVTLPGGLRLPVGLAVNTYTDYTGSCILSEPSQVKDQLKRYSEEYLLSQMDSGEILNTNGIFLTQENAYHWNAEFLCREMIAVARAEKIGE